MHGDYIIDRINIQRKVRFWRIVAALAVFITALHVMQLANVFKDKRHHIIRLTFDRDITYDPQIIRQLRQIEENKAVKAVIIHINSPGGSPVGSQVIYNNLRRISKTKKPVVAIIDEIAASGGYMVAAGADHIIANENSILGSIGVISLSTEFTETAHKLGITMNVFKTSPYKASPNPREKLTPQVELAVKEEMAEIFKNFSNLVKQRRKIADNNKDLVFSGRVFIGSQAVNLGLIDSLGDDDTALQWLNKKHKVSLDTPIIDHYFEEEGMNIRSLVTKVSNLISILNYNNKMLLY